MDRQPVRVLVGRGMTYERLTHLVDEAVRSDAPCIINGRGERARRLLTRLNRTRGDVLVFNKGDGRHQGLIGFDFDGGFVTSNLPG